MTARRPLENSHGADRSPGGRPRKYDEPSKPVTITLPQTTLRQLQQIDPDRGRAIVKLAKEAAWDTAGVPPLVEVVEIAGNTGVVLVGPSPILKKIPFLQLAEVGHARHLLAVSPGHSFPDLEIALTDLLEDLQDEQGPDRELISQLLTHFKNFRKTDSASTAQILLVRLRGSY